MLICADDSNAKTRNANLDPLSIQPSAIKPSKLFLNHARMSLLSSLGKQIGGYHDMGAISSGLRTQRNRLDADEDHRFDSKA